MRRPMGMLGWGLAACIALSAPAAYAAGAVVMSPDRSVLYWNLHKPSASLAADLAMSSCAARFGSCVLKKTFDSGCLGVARSGNHRVWGYAVRFSEREARLAALGECAQNGAACELQVVSCE